MVIGLLKKKLGKISRKLDKNGEATNIGNVSMIYNLWRLF